MPASTTVFANESTSVQRPSPSEYASYYGRYISLVPEHDVLEALETQIDDAAGVLRDVPEPQASVLHAPYTWTIKQVVNHIADGERIFGYRALRFARGDSTSLPGFDENEYARTAQVDRLRLADLVAEFEVTRRSNILMFRNLPDEAWLRSGAANGNVISVRALAYVLVGHTRHHLNIVRKRLGMG